MTTNVRIRALPKYPVNITGGVGTDVTRANGVTAITFDPTSIGTDPNPDLETFLLVGELPDGTPAKTTALADFATGTGLNEVLKISTYAVAQTTYVKPSVPAIELLGYYDVGDKGRNALYTRALSEPAHSGKVQTLDGAWWELSSFVVKPGMLGAIGDGVEDDTSAINRALSLGRQVYGDTFQYAVSGNVVLPQFTDLRASRFIQLTPNNTARRTLYWSHSSGSIVMMDVEVDRNGDGTGGSLNNAGGIWIAGGSRHHLERLRVIGGDKGSGIVLWNAAESKLIDPIVENIFYDDEAATDDQIHGIWCSLTTDCVVERPQVEGLYGNATGANINRFTRGIAANGNTRLSINDPKIRNVDQGIDITGSPYNFDCIVNGGQLYRCVTTAVKFANTGVRCKAIGVTAIECGYWPFIAAGPAEAGMQYVTEDCLFIGCVAVDTGAISSGDAFVPAYTCAFMINRGDFDDDYPRGIKFIDCVAIDNQAVKKMQYGFINQRKYSDTDRTSGKLNEVINCRCVGETTRAFSGFDDYNSRFTLSSNASISSGSFNDITWTNTSYDNAYMLNQSNKSEIIVLLQGVYSFSFTAGFSANATGVRISQVLVSTGTAPGRIVTSAPTSGAQAMPQVNGVVYLNKGDVIKCQVYQNSGGALGIETDYTSFTLTLLQATHYAS